MSELVKVGIIGATGYTGLELLRILLNHPQVEVSLITSRQFAGKRLNEVFPLFIGKSELVFEEYEPQKCLPKAEFFFTALPHQVAMKIVPELLESGKRVVDLSADFRLKKAEDYEKWYGSHQAKSYLSQAVYGLPELYGSQIASANLVANPGCYPTTAILGLAPFLKIGVIEPEGLIIDAKSGVSGAGRSVKLATLFCEVNEDMKAYKVAEHRHIPEIEQELSLLAGKEVKVTFVPHLIPLSRGMFTTIYARLSQKMDSNMAYELASEFYKDKPFVKVLPPPQVPQTICVRGSNECHLGLKVDTRTQTLIIMSAIDNLAKGASAQAVQNMNLMLGFPEDMGLKHLALCP